MSLLKLCVAQLYDGAEVLSNQTLLIQNGKIQSIKPCGPNEQVSAGLLIPGFIDTQVNGGGGALFNDVPTVETIKKIGRAHHQFGTTSWLPTLVTDSYEKMRQAAQAVAQYRANGNSDVVGMHFEGPFLSKEKKGIHAKKFIRQLSDRDMALLVRSDLGKVLLTLAPENVPVSQISELVNCGVIVSIGHSNATYQQTIDALEAGASGFTHLYNAMSPLTSREPGVVGAALLSKSTFSGIILDGIHLHPAAARLAYESATELMLVTDAMPPVGSEQTEFEFFGQSIVRRDNRLTDREGRLAGSTLDMLSAVQNATTMLQVDFLTAVDLASKNPAKFLGLQSETARLKPNYRADMLLINSKNNIESSWIGGEKIF